MIFSYADMHADGVDINRMKAILSSAMMKGEEKISRDETVDIMKCDPNKEVRKDHDEKKLTRQ